MPKFVNKNGHRISVEFSADKPGQLRTFRAGEVIDADGFLADRLKSTPGVEEASADDSRSWENHLARERDPGVSDGSSLHEVERGRIAAADAAVHATVVAGTRRVIGDDQAPFGPPTGTVTTKSLTGDPDHFGVNEANEPVEGADAADAVTTGARVPTGAEVHNAQHAAVKAADAAAAEVVEATSGKPAAKQPRAGGAKRAHRNEQSDSKD